MAVVCFSTIEVKFLPFSLFFCCCGYDGGTSSVAQLCSPLALNCLLCVCVRAALSRTADLLGLNPEQLAEVLTHRSMILRGEEISTPLTVEQVSHRTTRGL